MIKLLNRVHPLSRGLRASYSLNEFSGRYANNAVGYVGGTLTNDCYFTPRGVSFDGTTDYITGSFNGFDNAVQCSVSADVIFNTFAPSFQVIVSKWNGAIAEMKWHLFCDNLGRVYFQISDSSGANSTYIYSNFAMTVGIKYTITATWSGNANRMEMFFNGLKDTATTLNAGSAITIILPTASTEFRISTAQYNSTANNYSVNGFISNVNLYNRTLTGNEAMQLAINPNVMFATSNISSLYKARNQNNFFRMFN